MQGKQIIGPDGEILTGTYNPTNAVIEATAVSGSGIPTASDLISGKIAYVNGQKVVGTYKPSIADGNNVLNISVYNVSSVTEGYVVAVNICEATQTLDASYFEAFCDPMKTKVSNEPDYRTKASSREIRKRDTSCSYNGTNVSARWSTNRRGDVSCNYTITSNKHFNVVNRYGILAHCVMQYSFSGFFSNSGYDLYLHFFTF